MEPRREQFGVWPIYPPPYCQPAFASPYKQVPTGSVLSSHQTPWYMNTNNERYHNKRFVQYTVLYLTHALPLHQQKIEYQGSRRNSKT